MNQPFWHSHPTINCPYTVKLSFKQVRNQTPLWIYTAWFFKSSKRTFFTPKWVYDNAPLPHLPHPSNTAGYQYTIDFISLGTPPPLGPWGEGVCMPGWEGIHAGQLSYKDPACPINKMYVLSLRVSSPPPLLSLSLWCLPRSACNLFFCCPTLWQTTVIVHDTGSRHASSYTCSHNTEHIYSNIWPPALDFNIIYLLTRKYSLFCIWHIDL